MAHAPQIVGEEVVHVLDQEWHQSQEANQVLTQLYDRIQDGGEMPFFFIPLIISLFLVDPDNISVNEYKMDYLSELAGSFRWYHIQLKWCNLLYIYILAVLI